ncbi:hypothetical protein [Streptomyces sp. S.PB5]|uniref:hypothetical protein n=1 Tax=Streptomyces sp. S.PB5 TaxID=3020844 RepID=UPI0025B151A9|nr:hypothetical protein [Streptomyces sp. S.PB5]MDN3029247.1 hypothetical protein [Streptomyces sp. S.PB5]
MRSVPAPPARRHGGQLLCPLTDGRRDMIELLTRLLPPNGGDHDVRLGLPVPA